MGWVRRIFRFRIYPAGFDGCHEDRRIGGVATDSGKVATGSDGAAGRWRRSEAAADLPAPRI
ncbi:hypothetical protein ACLOJK_036521 [Asimina triloba]